MLTYTEWSIFRLARRSLSVKYKLPQRLTRGKLSTYRFVSVVSVLWFYALSKTNSITFYSVMLTLDLRTFLNPRNARTQHVSPYT